MSQIHIRLLQAALAVADHLSFSRAASQLKITQPGLTKQIQDLESALGVMLFERDNKRVQITEPGCVFIEHARLCVFHLDRAIYLTRAAANGAEAVLNFGSSPYIDPYFVSMVLSVRLPLYPTLRVHAHSHFSHELTRQVMAGELDLALITAGRPNAQLNSFEIAKSPLFVVMRQQERMAGRHDVSLNDFHDRVWIVFGTHVHPALHEGIFAQAERCHVRAREVHHVTTAEEAAHLIVKLRGLAILTRTGAWRVSRDGLIMRPLSEPELVVTTTLITRLEDDSRLLGEYVRATMRRLNTSPRLQQKQLPLNA